MSILNSVRHPLKNFIMHPRIFIYRQQSQRIVDLLNKKTPIEIESNDELENLPCENTIEWNKKLKAYRIRGEAKKALKFFEIGLRKHQFQPDYITYISILELCKDIKDVDNGRYIHRHILSTDIRDNTRIQSLLMDMYMKGGDLESARELFDTLKHRTAVEYNAMMTTYNAHQHPERTIELFNSMRESGKIKPNNISYMLYIQACMMLKSFEQGKAVHEEIKQKTTNYLKNKELSNQIIAMYIASSDYLTAEELFKQVKVPSVQNYVGLMNYFNQSKNWQRTLELYDQMKLQRKNQADLPLYLAVLTAIKEEKNLDKAKEIQDDLLKQDLWQNHIEIQNLLKEILQ